MAVSLITFWCVAAPADDAGDAGGRALPRERSTANLSTAHHSDDAHECARIRAGDIGAFTAVYRRYYSAVWSFARRYTLSDAEADDITQEVFRTLWERRTTLVVRGTLRGLLFAAAHNRALNAIRNADTAGRLAREQMTAEGRPPGMSHEDMVPATQEAIERQEIHDAVARVVETFPARRREVFLLKWRDDLTYGEIATLLGVSRKAVELHLTNAYRVLRAELRDLFA